MLIVWLPLIAAASPERVQYVVPLANNTEVYQFRTEGTSERRVFTVDHADRLLVLRTGPTAYMVRDKRGRCGWIERRFVVSGAKRQTAAIATELLRELEDGSRKLRTAATDGDGDPGRSFLRDLSERLDGGQRQETGEM
jgi:hypothetical protein